MWPSGGFFFCPPSLSHIAPRATWGQHRGVRFGATLCEVMIGHESSMSHLRAKEEGWGENCQTARQNAGADQRRQPRRRLQETAPPIGGPFSGLGPLFPISGETGGLGWALPSEIQMVQQ
jgi:hypothetical protein